MLPSCSSTSIRFKLVNDTLGHVKGDELLQQVAGRLKDCLRKSDTLARLGGDEFTVVLPELHHRRDAEIIAGKFLETLQQPFFVDGSELYISASIGIAVYPHDGESIDTLLRHADIAMYHVKGQGKNNHAFFRRRCWPPPTRRSCWRKTCAMHSNVTSWKCTTSRISTARVAKSSAPRR